MSSKLSGAQEQIALLRGMTIRTGMIHDAQILQLKMWMLLIPGAISGEVSITAKTDTTFPMVDMQIKAKSARTSKKMHEMYPHVEQWCKQLLWPETALLIHINGAKVYDARQ